MMRAVLKSVGSTTNRVITNKTKMNLSTLLCRSFTNNFAAYNNRTVNSRTVNLLTRSFSIADVLIDELQHETSAHKIEQDFVDIKNKISKSFAISDQDGIGMVHLERKQNGEVIEVKFDCQNEAEMNMGDIEGEGEDEDAAPPVYISFEVIVTKGNNKMLFDCLAGEAVEIENVRFFPNNKDTSDITVYGGPRFEELDEKVQEEFYAYLEDRKIDDDMSFFILSYAREKEQSEYVHWLKNVIDFTSK